MTSDYITRLSRLRFACEELERYGGEPIPGIVEVVELLATINEDAKHGRPSVKRSHAIHILDGIRRANPTFAWEWSVGSD